MICWRCGRVDHAEWCSDGTANDCTHCGGNPCRWWCLGPEIEQGQAFARPAWRFKEPQRLMEPV